MPTQKSKFSYNSKSQVKIKKPKSPKFGYTSKSQVKITKPSKPRKESLGEVARNVIFEIAAEKLTVMNPQTKKRIKVTSALQYEKSHPAYKAAVALLKKKNVALPGNVHSVKPGETIPLFNMKPYEDPNRLRSKQGEVISGDDAREHLDETQRKYLDEGIAGSSKDAIEDYTGSSFSWINAYLRGDIDSATELAIQNAQETLDSGDIGEDSWDEVAQSMIDSSVRSLDDAFEGIGAVLQTDIQVYRGVTDDSGIVDEIMSGGVGTILTDGAFVSTSLNESTAMDFGGLSGVVFKVIARKGTRAIYPQAADMGINTEEELILNRGTSMRVIHIEKTPMKSKSNYGHDRSHVIVTVETVVGEK